MFRFRIGNSKQLKCHLRRSVSYVQGQSPTPTTREYFYYIDHQGQLFLDDTKVKNFITCFKDKKFLAFFFRRLRVNSTDRYAEDFPYISLCGPETNYIHCEDLPVVFSHLLNPDKNVVEDISNFAASESQSVEPELLTYGGTGGILTVPFHPKKLAMLPGSGRVYHCGPESVGGAGLVKSSLALELSPFFEYRLGDEPETSSPVGFKWRGKSHDLDNHVLTLLAHRESMQ